MMGIARRCFIGVILSVLLAVSISGTGLSQIEDPPENESPSPEVLENPKGSVDVVPQEITGVWYGWIHTDPVVGNYSFSALIALQNVDDGELAGLVLHPSIPCGGETRLQSSGLNSIHTSTDYTFGSCLDGRHVLTLTSDGNLSYEWHDPSSARVDRGILERIGGFGADLPASHLGTWTGTIVMDPDYVYNRTFFVELALTGGVLGNEIGVTTIPIGNCTGSLSLTGVEDSRVSAGADFSSGSCTDGSIDLIAQPDGSLLYEWHDPASDRVDSGVLTRISGPVSTECQLSYFSSTTTEGLLRQDVAPWASEAYGGVMNYGVNPPLLLPFIHYGNNRDTIANWGCAMTSSAMMVNYYAFRQGKTFRTDPHSLNYWLQINGGYATGPWLPEPPDTPTYVADSLVRYASGGNPSNPLPSIETYASNQAIQLRWTAGDAKSSRETTAEFVERTRATLNAELCANDPVILGVIRGTYQHYVLATGVTTVNNVATWRIHDPLEPAPTTLLARYGNQYNKMMRFDGAVPGRTLSITIHSPVEAILVDSSGRRTGFDPHSGMTYREIPGASYMEDTIGAADGQGGSISISRLDVADAALGEYRLLLIETGSGPYTVNILATKNNGTANQITLSGQADGTKTTIYYLDYSGDITEPVEFTQPPLNTFLPYMQR